MASRRSAGDGAVQRWEYQTMVVAPDKLAETLEAAGTNSWELIGFSIEEWSSSGWVHRYRLVLKRPKE
jgi:hypothetical protein